MRSLPFWVGDSLQPTTKSSFSCKSILNWRYLRAFKFSQLFLTHWKLCSDSRRATAAPLLCMVPICSHYGGNNLWLQIDCILYFFLAYLTPWWLEIIYESPQCPSRRLSGSMCVAKTTWIIFPGDAHPARGPCNQVSSRGTALCPQGFYPWIPLSASGHQQRQPRAKLLFQISPRPHEQFPCEPSCRCLRLQLPHQLLG